MGAKTPLPRWRIMTTCWTSAHRPQTIWNQKADDWDSWEITLLPLHQRIRRKSTSCNLTPNVFKTLPLKAIWEFGPCEHKLPVLLDWCPPTSAHTISPLHTNLQVANFQRCECVFTCPIMEVRSRVWCPLSCVCILYKWLCFCVLYCTVLYRVGRLQSMGSQRDTIEWLNNSNCIEYSSTVYLFQVQDVQKQA